ncbi:MAG: substrate-binding domain-containing protein [Verrucomicrobiales bacterium]|nr:substrate-binding domain-containing protein [Verrucomicrobiales bacterium]
MTRSHFLATSFAAGCAVLLLTGCKKKAGSAAQPAGPKFAFVINNASPFWSYAKAGIKKAEKDFGLSGELITPPTGSVEEQNRILENILQNAATYKGVAISPCDPKNQTEILNKVAAAMPLICHDSDAPASNRLFYVGTSNLEAGKLMAKLVKEKLPDGGGLVLFVGSLDAQNAKDRRQGIIQELSDGAVQDAPNGQPVTLGKYTLLDTMTDTTDRAAAQSNVEAAVRRFGDQLKAVGGLWSYNTPQCLNGLKSAGKLGQVKVFGFDEEEDTLNAIEAGTCEGTIVQQPFEFGYQSMKYLKELADGKKLEIPADKAFPVPALIIRKEGLQEYRTKLAALRKEGES